VTLYMTLSRAYTLVWAAERLYGVRSVKKKGMHVLQSTYQFSL